MTKAMTIFEVRESILNRTFKVGYMARPKYLKEDFVFNEDKSVKWNREEVERVNKSLKEDYEEYKKNVSDAEDSERKAIIKAFSNEYDISESKVETAYNHAYSESQSSGIYDVTITLESVMDLYTKMNSMD